MNKYQKIQSIYKRDPDNGYRFTDEFSTPEIAYLANNIWVATEKIDGRNHRIIWNGGIIEHRGKTDKAHMPDHLLNDLRGLITPEKLKEAFGETEVCLYGEAFGPKIQSGGNYSQEHSFILFDVKIDEWWLEREDIVDIGAKLDIEVVPVYGEMTLSEAVNATREGFNSIFGNFIAEGLILKPKKQLFARNGDRIVTKVKHKDFK